MFIQKPDNISSVYSPRLDRQVPVFKQWTVLTFTVICFTYDNKLYVYDNMNSAHLSLHKHICTLFPNINNSGVVATKILS